MLKKYIIEPENKGMVILSFTDIGIISITDAISAPKIKIYILTGKLKHIPINIDEIKPSFESLDDKNENVTSNKKLKEKKNFKNLKSSQAILIGLDKITAKSSELVVNFI